MSNEAPKAVGVIDFDSLIHVCKQLCISLNDALSKPKACNFAIIRLCGKQSNTLDRSVSSAAYSPPWSSDLLSFSIIATRPLCGLKIFLKPV